MKRPLKYPTASIVGEKFGLHSEEYKRVYALEQWATRHGYEGHRPHIVPKKMDKNKQVNMAFYRD